MIDIVCGMQNRYLLDSDEIDTDFTAPTDLYEMWKSHCEKQAEKPVVLPIEGPAGASSADLKALPEDRVTPGVLAQTMVFFAREVRRWNKTSFIGTCAALFFTGLLFGTLTRLLAQFSYAAILQTT